MQKYFSNFSVDGATTLYGTASISNSKVGRSQKWAAFVHSRHLWYIYGFFYCACQKVRSIAALKQVSCQKCCSVYPLFYDKWCIILATIYSVCFYFSLCSYSSRKVILCQYNCYWKNQSCLKIRRWNIFKSLNLVI